MGRFVVYISNIFIRHNEMTQAGSERYINLPDSILRGDAMPSGEVILTDFDIQSGMLKSVVEAKGPNAVNVGIFFGQDQNLSLRTYPVRDFWVSRFRGKTDTDKLHSILSEIKAEGGCDNVSAIWLNSEFKGVDTIVNKTRVPFHVFSSSKSIAKYIGTIWNNFM
ncbi:MAG: hypothetical protein US52_C0008G0013 [candidate division WS6 bacterium GW2011_GWA2_37_6]|uniref:Uncharacterized protein n=1 Tax=candidate division WS6 bacterium GW2011_GWA2_37_6 TaxID=1619087 RepID=A0A0G0JH84_9BACT|nr:MAG: hypothetical protein US52_C0008G0013 [candidate division WS6 bacterium GW2011_GWA2_37_6]